MRCRLPTRFRTCLIKRFSRPVSFRIPDKKYFMCPVNGWSSDLNEFREGLEIYDACNNMLADTLLTVLVLARVILFWKCAYGTEWRIYLQEKKQKNNVHYHFSVWFCYVCNRLSVNWDVDYHFERSFLGVRGGRPSSFTALATYVYTCFLEL